MDDEERADFEQQLADERRYREEEAERYRAAHPEHEHCAKHPDRAVVDRSVCTMRHCAQCIAEREAAYADHMTSRDLSGPAGAPDYAYVGDELHVMGNGGYYVHVQRDPRGLK